MRTESYWVVATGRNYVCVKTGGSYGIYWGVSGRQYAHPFSDFRHARTVRDLFWPSAKIIKVTPRKRAGTPPPCTRCGLIGSLDLRFCAPCKAASARDARAQGAAEEREAIARWFEGLRLGTYRQHAEVAASIRAGKHRGQR